MSEWFHFPGWPEFYYDLAVNLLATLLLAVLGGAIFLVWRQSYIGILSSRDPEHDLNGLWWARYITEIDGQIVKKVHVLWVRHHRHKIQGQTVAGDAFPYELEGQLRHRCFSGTWRKTGNRFDDTHGTFLLTYDASPLARGNQLTGKYLAKEGGHIIANDYQWFRITETTRWQKLFRKAAQKGAIALCQENGVPDKPAKESDSTDFWPTSSPAVKR